MKIFLGSLLFILAFNIHVPAQRRRQSDLAQVVAAENSFADSAAKSGTRTAFLGYAADTALVFSDEPENAKESWQKRVPNTTLLSWRPAWADVSADGTLGYTTGPWAYSRGSAEPPVAWGEYFTIWKKQPDGSWKFLLDLGIGHDKADVVNNNWKSPDIVGKTSVDKAPTDVWNKLEAAFVENVKKQGAVKTYEKLASAQIRLLLDGHTPFQGKAAALAQIANDRQTRRVLGGGASSDLAYAYGEYDLKRSDGKTEKGFYARVWKREPRGWRIAAEVQHPI